MALTGLGHIKATSKSGGKQCSGKQVVNTVQDQPRECSSRFTLILDEVDYLFESFCFYVYITCDLSLHTCAFKVKNHVFNYPLGFYRKYSK